MKKYNLFAITSFLALSLSAQIKNAETHQFSVKGNCSDAKELIEKVGNQKKIASVVYDATTQTVEITVDKTKTNASEVLKKIALAGFDNTEYFAPPFPCYQGTGGTGHLFLRLWQFFHESDL